MIEAGEDLAFGQEAAEDLVTIHPALDQLEGDALLKVAVRALGEVDDAHAAVPQLADQTVGADERARSMR